MDGKTVAVPKGSCTDRFAQATFKRFNIQPKEYLNQNIEVITSNFRAGKLDAAVMWEPTPRASWTRGSRGASPTGKSVQENDGGFLAMRADLIKQRPDVVKAWLKAELDAQLFIADPKNASEVIKMAKEQTTGFSEKVLWNSLYGRYPDAAGGGEMRNTMHYTFTPRRASYRPGGDVLYSIKSISAEKMRPEAIEAKWTEEILKERGLKAPIAEVKALPASQRPSKRWRLPQPPTGRATTRSRCCARPRLSEKLPERCSRASPSSRAWPGYSARVRASTVLTTAIRSN